MRGYFFYEFPRNLSELSFLLNDFTRSLMAVYPLLYEMTHFVFVVEVAFL